MQKRRLLVIPLLLWGASLEAAPPDGVGGTISFSQAREIILTRNAGLKSAGTEAEAANAAVSQAGAIPNPTVGVALDKFGANEIEIGVEQTVELGGKRRLRTETAQHELGAAENQRDLARLELDAEIVRRFIPIAAVSKKLALLDSIAVLAESTKAQIEKRVEAGAAKKTDLVRAEIDIEKLKLERSELVREDEQVRRKFAALGGEQDSALMSVAGTISHDVPIPSLDDLGNAMRTNPRIKAADLEGNRLATQQRQLRAEVVPDLSLSAGYLRNNVDNSNSALVGVAMDVPLFNRNTSAQRRVELQQRAVDERRQGELRLLDADVQDLRSRLMEIDKRIAGLKSDVIPRAEQVYAMLQEYYAAGSAGFLDLAASQSEMLHMRMDLLDAEIERAQTLTDLMQMTSLHIQIVQ